MKAVLINGSPKRENSASKKLLAIVGNLLRGKAEFADLWLGTDELTEKEAALLQEAEVWIFSFPLYVDGIPSHLLTHMVAMEEKEIGRGKAHVYGIVNCGFYEGIQAECALAVMKNWCARADLQWGSGVGVGGGGAVCNGIPTTEKGPLAPVFKAFAAMTEEVLQNKPGENRYVSILFPKFLYRMSAQMGFRQLAGKNGWKVRDLGRRPEPGQNMKTLIIYEEKTEE